MVTLTRRTLNPSSGAWTRIAIVTFGCPAMITDGLVKYQRKEVNSTWYRNLTGGGGQENLFAVVMSNGGEDIRIRIKNYRGYHAIEIKQTLPSHRKKSRTCQVIAV